MVAVEPVPVAQAAEPVAPPTVAVAVAGRSLLPASSVAEIAAAAVAVEREADWSEVD